MFQAVHDSRFRPAVHWRETLPENPADLIATRFEKRKGDQDYPRFLAWEAASARNRVIPSEEDRRLRVAAYGGAVRDMQLQGGLPAAMDWRLIQPATLSLAIYPIAFTQITRLVTRKDAEDPAFQAEWADFLRVLGRKLFG